MYKYVLLICLKMKHMLKIRQECNSRITEPDIFSSKHFLKEKISANICLALIVMRMGILTKLPGRLGKGGITI